MPSSPQAALAAKLLKVTSEIGAIPKSGFNSHFNYAFYKEEDFIDAVRPLFVKHGVAITPNVLRDTVTEVKTSSGGTQFLVSVAVEYTLIDIESGDSMQMVSIGHGADSGDKGLPKAMTGAMKAFLRQLFLISAGSADAEDDQNDAAARADRPVQRPQQQQQQPRQQQQQQPPPGPAQGDGGVDNATGFCPTHRKPFRIGRKGNRFCPTKIGENPDGSADWCNEGYEYDQQHGYLNAQPPPQQQQQQAQPRNEASYDQSPMDVDDIPF